MEINKVLYIDDELVNLELFNYNFRKKCALVLASSGVEGLELLAKYSDIRVVISDMKMPGMNGLDFISKAKEQYPDKGYYILTGYHITNEIQDALDCGLILGYLKKPFDKPEIERIIQTT